VKCEKKADPCDPCKESILDKLRAKLHKNDCCEAPKVVKVEKAPKCEKKVECDPCKESILDKLRAKLQKNDCCEAPKCEKKVECDPCKVSFLDKLRAKLHKNDCCDTCDSAAPAAAPKAAPQDSKKLPAGGKAAGIIVPVPATF